MRTKLIYHPWSTFEAYDEPSIKLCERLHEILPHGSGINYAWDITRNKRNHVFYASNCYQAMDENGMYCHAYDFTVSYKHNGSEAYKPCEYCKSTGKRHIKDVSMSNQPAWYTCNVCNGSGKLKLPEFEFIRLNFHGQREYACCGYDLKNYLAELLTLE